MSFIDVVKQRKSIRKFLDKPVEREKIQQCIEAARLAPSACNSQPWKYIVIDDKALKEAIDATFSGPYAMCGFCKSASVIVAIVSEKSSLMVQAGGLVKGTSYHLIDIGISGEHFALQAAELGLGTCWVGWFNERAVKKVLHIPRGKRVEILFALGYPEPSQLARESIRKSTAEMSAFNAYENRT